MPCCGKGRAELNQAWGAATTTEPPAGEVYASPSGATVEFEYVGTTGLTAVGPITGRRYRFDGPGARVAVDARDAPSLMAVPRLRRVRASAPPAP